MGYKIKDLDTVRERFSVSYDEARKAMKAAGGDVVEALVYLEKRQGWSDKVRVGTGQVKLGLRHLWEKGNETKVRVKKDQQTVFEFPATVGVLGIIGILASSELAVIGGLGTIAAMAKNYAIEVGKQ